jgi:enoyl-CoA hydratase/carnithine racemase
MSAAEFQPCGGVSLQIADGVARVTLKRGDRVNALSAETMTGLRDAARALRTETVAHAVIIHGDPVFSAGADLKDPAMLARAGKSLLEKRELLRLGPDMCDAWEALDQVTIAAIEGFCIGGGVALAAACDFRVMARSSYMRLPEVPLGMNMSWHSIPRLVALCGPARAKHLTLFGEKLCAADALAQGLADQVVDDGGALAAAEALAAKAAALPPIAARIAKRAISQAASALSAATSYADLDQYALASTTADHKEAVAAFIEKRTPMFRGD